MFEILFLIWFLIAILPVLIFIEGWGMFAKWMNKRHYWPKPIPTSPSLAYTLLVILIILLIVFLSYGFRW